MRFSVPLIKGVFNNETMDVITAQYSQDKKKWIFKPVFDAPLGGVPLPFLGDFGHPLAGYRQFGMVSDDNQQTFTFYTRAVDRPYNEFDRLISGAIFKGVNKLWSTIMENARNFINSNGDSATIGATSNKRISWSEMSEADKNKIQASGDYNML